MSELWINFLQKEAAAREGGDGGGLPTSPGGGSGGGHVGSEPGTPTPSGKK